LGLSASAGGLIRNAVICAFCAGIKTTPPKPRISKADQARPRNARYSADPGEAARKAT
jgi:hypothetical protein